MVAARGGRGGTRDGSGRDRRHGGTGFLGSYVAEDLLDQAIDWQHARDIAQAFRTAAFAPESDLSRHVYNVAGELATIREAVETVRRILPDADLEVSDTGVLPWTQDLDTSAAESDLGYEVEYDLETGFRQYVNTLREGAGLEPA